MLLQDFSTVLTKDSMKLLTPQRTSVDITRHGTLLYLTPDIVPYHPDMKIVEEELDQHMSTLDVDMTKVPELPTGVDAVEQLKSLIDTLKSTCYHTDVWQLDEANHTLTRVHECPRRTFFTPESSDCPVPLDRLNGQRTTHLDYGAGDVREVLDNFRNTELPNQMIDEYWKGRTVFQLKTVPTRRYHSKAPPDNTAVPKEEPEHTEVQSSTVRNPVRNSQGSPDLNTDRGRTLNQKLMTFRNFDDTEFHKVLLELFETPETETGELRTSDCWIHIPAAWIRSHHVPRRTLYVPEETEVPHDGLGSHRLTLFYETSTDQDGKSYEDQWNMDNNRDVGFIWTGLCFRLRTVSLTLLWNKTHMTKQQDTPRDCIGQMNPLNSREKYTISHTYHICHGVNIVQKIKANQHGKLTNSPSSKLTTVLSILDRMLENDWFSLLWTFRLDFV